jgi:hypothetical protein
MTGGVLLRALLVFVLVPHLRAFRMYYSRLI